jgi:hypothetical protein
MKNHKFSILAVSLILVAISITFTNCEGPEGPRGPAGEQGPIGPQGGMLPYIPESSGLRGTTWVHAT